MKITIRTTKTVLVAGGTGYVGGRLVQHLAQAGWRVLVGTRHMPIVSPAWIPTNSKFVELHFRGNQENTSPEIDLNGEIIDAIVNLVAVNENIAARNPNLAFEVATVAVRSLANLAASQPNCRFVQLSTAHVYGSPLVGDISEEIEPVPGHPYSSAHRAAELELLKSTLENIVILRLSNSVGSPAHAGVDRWSLLANDLANQAVVNRRMVLKTTGIQQRDFIALKEVCRAVELILDTPSLGSGCVMNLGSGQSMSVYEMAMNIAEIAESLLGYHPELIAPKAQQGEVAKHLNFQVERLSSFGFQPQQSLDSEIKSLLLFCQQAALEGITLGP